MRPKEVLKLSLLEKEIILQGILKELTIGKKDQKINIEEMNDNELMNLKEKLMGA